MSNGDTNTSGTSTSDTGSGYEPRETGTESSLSNWVGPYVTDMLGKGQALADEDYQSYQGPLTAGTSGLQNQAFSGIAGLSAPATGAFDATAAQNYMNPYLQAALQPQLAEARRQSEISGLADSARLTKAGAYGGTRQAVMDAERSNSLQRNLAGITGTGYRDAFDRAGDLFSKDRGYGLEALAAQQAAGREQRSIEQEGIAADRAQFEEERLYPYKQTQYMQSLLQGLPLAAQSYNYSKPSALSNILGGLLGMESGGEGGGGLADLYRRIFGGGDKEVTVEDAAGVSDESIVNAENAGNVVV